MSVRREGATGRKAAVRSEAEIVSLPNLGRLENEVNTNITSMTILRLDFEMD